MKNIILINGYRVGRPFLPTGIGYVAQAIENAGYDYDVCDVNLQTHDQIVQMVKDSKPQYVGCGTMSYEVEKNYQLLQAIRESMPDVIIILGGPHAIAAQKLIFRECSSIDIVIQGEGEESIVKLLRGDPWHSIPGILTRDSQAEPIPHELLDIDNVAFPKYHKVDLSKYGNTMNIASSRGCVYKCSFCGARKFLGKKWRAFKLTRMIEEFEYWYGKGYRQFYFSDSLFALNKKRVIDFCAYIVESGYNNVEFTADGLRADHLTFEILQHMKKANFKSLTLGVESVNDKTLVFFKKGESFRQIDNAISIADSLGFDITIYLIIGAPEESYNDAIKSIQYAMKYKNIVNAVFSKLMPIMGTSYYDYAIEHKLLFDESVYYPKIEAYGTNEMHDTHNSVEEIWKALYPTIEIMSGFMVMRNQIKNVFSSLGFYNIGVKKLNMITQISLNSVMVVFVNTVIRMAKNMKIKRIFKRLTSIAKVSRLRILSIEMIRYFYSAAKDGLIIIRNPRLAQAFRIKSDLTKAERVVLYRLALGKETILEIGSYIGASACSFGAAMKKSGSGRMFCIDTWNNDAMSEGRKDTYDEFTKNTNLFTEFIIPVRGLSTAVVKHVASQIQHLDLLFIDGDHSYEGVKTDWVTYKCFLRQSSIVVFHDWGWAEGVKRVILEDATPLVSSFGSMTNMWWGTIKT